MQLDGFFGSSLLKSSTFFLLSGCGSSKFVRPSWKFSSHSCSSTQLLVHIKSNSANNLHKSRQSQRCFHVFDPGTLPQDNNSYKKTITWLVTKWRLLNGNIAGHQYWGDIVIQNLSFKKYEIRRETKFLNLKWYTFNSVIGFVNSLVSHVRCYLFSCKFHRFFLK